MHAANLDVPVVDDDKGGEHLADELLNRGDDKDIIFETQEEDDKGCRHKILKVSELIKMKGKQATEDKPCEYTDPAKRCNGRVMDFPGIGHVEQLFHFRHVDNGGNSQEGNGKRNSYRK